MWTDFFGKEPFFYGHDNYDQLVKIAKVVNSSTLGSNDFDCVAKITLFGYSFMVFLNHILILFSCCDTGAWYR